MFNGPEFDFLVSVPCALEKDTLSAIAEWNVYVNQVKSVDSVVKSFRPHSLFLSPSCNPLASCKNICGEYPKD